MGKGQGLCAWLSASSLSGRVTSCRGVSPSAGQDPVPRPLPQARAEGSLPRTPMPHRLGTQDTGKLFKSALLATPVPRPHLPPHRSSEAGGPEPDFGPFACSAAILEDPAEGPGSEGVQSQTVHPKKCVQSGPCEVLGVVTRARGGDDVTCRALCKLIVWLLGRAGRAVEAWPLLLWHWKPG